jgi:hypothetical protein
MALKLQIENLQVQTFPEHKITSAVSSFYKNSEKLEKNTIEVSHLVFKS